MPAPCPTRPLYYPLMSREAKAAIERTIQRCYEKQETIAAEQTAQREAAEQSEQARAEQRAAQTEARAAAAAAIGRWQGEAILSGAADVLVAGGNVVTAVGAAVTGTSAFLGYNAAGQPVYGPVDSTNQPVYGPPSSAPLAQPQALAVPLVAGGALLLGGLLYAAMR